MPRPPAAVAGVASGYDRGMIRRAVILFLACSALAACSSAPPVVPRTAIVTDPADARCRLSGTQQRLPPRPAPLEAETLALGLPVAVTCERDGFQPTVEMLHPLPAPPLASALAAGAKLSPLAAETPPPGVPATSPVPATLTVRLRPLLFTSPGARDRYYEQLRIERDARWARFAEQVERECTASAGRPPSLPGPTPQACRAARDSVAQQRAEDLRRLELDRRRATFQ